MNLHELKTYAVKMAKENPTLKSEIYDFVQLAIDEIEDNRGSEDHECNLAQRDIEFIVNEKMIEDEMQNSNSPGEEETVHGYSNIETFTMIAYIHNGGWMDEAFENIRQYDNPLRLGVLFTELVFKSDNDGLKDSFGRIAFSNINWIEIYENLKEMMPKVRFEVGDYLMIVDGDDLFEMNYDLKGKVLVFDSYDGNEEGAIDVTDHSGEDVKYYHLFEHRFVKVTHEWRLVQESDRWISEWRNENNDIIGINYFQGHDSFNDLEDDFFFPDPMLTQKVLAKNMPTDDAIWSVFHEENISKEELLERLYLAHAQATFLFDQLIELCNGEDDTMVMELFYSHNIKTLTDLTTDEYKFDK
jgi:hypothetical protein